MGRVKITTIEKSHLGTPYFLAEVFLTSWDVDLNQQTWEDMLSWCHNRFGQRGDPWNKVPERWYCNDGNFWFKEESDRTLFLLKWL